MNGVRYYLGSFGNKDDAIRRRRQTAWAFHGEFAYEGDTITWDWWGELCRMFQASSSYGEYARRKREIADQMAARDLWRRTDRKSLGERHKAHAGLPQLENADCAGALRASAF